MSAFVSGIYWGFLGCWSYLVFFYLVMMALRVEREEGERGGERERSYDTHSVHWPCI